MKKLYKIYIALIFIILALPGLLVLLLPQRSYSTNENRYLENFPDFSADGILSGDFQENFTDALNDQFFIRDFMTGLSTGLKKTMGAKDIGGVYLAKDKYYISKVTDNDIPKASLIQNLKYLSYFAGKQDVPVYTMLVPSPGTILDAKLPPFAPFYNPDYIYDTAETLLDAENIIDLRKAYKNSPDSSMLYFKTDHHWTLNGAYAAYCAFCDKAGIKKYPYNSFNPEKMCSNFYGTMYSKVLDYTAEPDEIYAVQTPQTENAEIICDGKKSTGIYDDTALSKKDKYGYFFGGNYGRTDISTSSGTGLKLLVIKDSYANSFVPFLLGGYHEITMIDARYYDGSILKTASFGGYDHILILYETSNFAEDKNIYKLAK